MNGKRQKIQPGLALQPRDWGEPSVGGSQGVEPSMAKSTLESPAPTDRMSPSTLNPVEPPWYGPVCPVVWEGRHREVPPYPDSSESTHPVMTEASASTGTTSRQRPNALDLSAARNRATRANRISPGVDDRQACLRTETMFHTNANYRASARSPPGSYLLAEPGTARAYSRQSQPVVRKPEQDHAAVRSQRATGRIDINPALPPASGKWTTEVEIRTLCTLWREPSLFF